MARTDGPLDSDQTVIMAKVTELKKELQRSVNNIVEDDYDGDCSVEAFDKAEKCLLVLKELKRKRLQKTSHSLKLHETLSCPDEFKCPLSNELMRDPVIVSSGQTYDRSVIQKWLKAGNLTCPQTQQVLSHTILTPNHLVKDMIVQWCKSRGVELLDSVNYINEEGITHANRDHFLSLLEKMSSTVPEQKAAAKELRRLTKKMPSFRALFSEALNAIPKLLNPLSHGNSHSKIHPDLQEDVITTLLNLSIHDNNKKLVVETPIVLPLLMEALENGTVQTRANAAAALFTLSALDSNKAIIGKSGALKPLINLLEEGHPLAMKDVASAIFSLCIIHENKARAVGDGAVKVILRKIMERILLDELLAILAMLANHQKAVEELGEDGGIHCLLSIIRETDCQRNKENCIAILHTICVYDRTKLKELREENYLNCTITDLAKTGTSRAKRKANGILERLNRLANISHTA